MAYEVEHQASHIRALTETIAVPPYIPVTSPSAKRKRDVLLYISPLSTDSSFNSSAATTTSFGSDGTCEGCERDSATARKSAGGVGVGVVGRTATGGGAGGCGCEDMRNRGGVPAADKSGVEDLEVPSPRTRIANKLEGLNLENGFPRDKEKDAKPSKSAKAINSWRKSGVGKFTGFADAKATEGGMGDTAESMPMDHEDDDSELMRTPKKKKKPSQRELKPQDVEVTPKKRKGKAKAAFEEPSEVEMTTIGSPALDTETQVPDNGPESPTGSAGTEPFAFFGSSSKQPQPLARRKLRSPPPSIPEDEEAHRPAEEEEADTDSDPDYSGIGYRPTAQQRELRNQKRMQQVKEYKARESREARAKRTAERRRRNVAERGASATSSTSSLLTSANADEGDEMVDVQKSQAPKKVHFATD
ncbi:hypothetical protein DRE_05429 [Drechslerella stenobrocha 248]|uniref:Uncharacterized protein n=1 Tax=Drechslerella stenobrocha 248 TaxID=1043628 RepID=W7HNF8_9PEZI|nr:hypothetical protein DRE_05429 [Drechslerella stenobrocha 248]